MKVQDSEVAVLLKAMFSPKAGDAERKKTESGFIDLHRRVPNPQAAGLLERLKAAVESAATEPSAAESWLQAVVELRGAGWHKSAHVVAVARASALGRLDLEKVAPVLPDAESVEAWRKSTGTAVPALELRLLQDPKAVYASAGADWLLAHSKPAALTPLLRVFFTRASRPAPLKAWEVALAVFLQKDPKAERLAAALAAAGNEAVELDALATAVRSSTETTIAVTKSLAVLAASRGAVFPGGAFVRSVFVDLQTTKGKSRRQACAMLALLTGSLLRADPLSATGQEMLVEAGALGEELKNGTRSPELQKDTWVVQSLLARETDPSACLTIDGARRWAIVYERVVQEKQPTAALEVLGYNLGLREIGERGKIVTYVPREHEDTEGGLLPGASVEIVVPGWSFESHPIIRARVRACDPNPCNPPSSASI